MEPNPLAKQLKASKAKSNALHRQRARLDESLTWHDGFDRSKAEKALTNLAAIGADLTAKREVVSAQLTKAKRKTKALEDKASPGWNPTYWFSDARDKAKAKLRNHNRMMNGLKSEKRALAHRMTQTAAEQARLSAEIQRYDSFDRDAVLADLAHVDEALPLREIEIDDLAIRKAEVDRQIKVPMKELHKLSAELNEAEGEVQDLDGRVDRLEREKADAERLNEQITRAATSYDRAMLHQECERRFGNGSPGVVARDRRHDINRTRTAIEGKRRHVAALERNIGKLEVRIAAICERALRPVRGLIIDGNNLCYEGGRFIGLAALKPLCRRLADSYEVTVVFDSSIRRSLRTNDSDLRRTLAGTKVHVVATRGKADETVLHAAGDDFVFVLSNDRYAEYPDLPAVRDNRLIRHEILNGRVLVHDLEVDEPFVSRS